MSPELYDMIPVFCGIFFVIYGLLMMVCPKIMVKKEWREDPDRLAKARKNGPVVMICGIVIACINLI